MKNEDRKTMDALGITCKSKDVYHYKEFRYDRLSDAVRYAEIDAEQLRVDGERS